MNNTKQKILSFDRIFVLAEKERFELPTRKYSRIPLSLRTRVTPYFLPFRSPFFVHRTRSNSKPAPFVARVRYFTYTQKTRIPTKMSILAFGGEGEIRTLAPVSRPTPLAGAPLRPT